MQNKDLKNIYEKLDFSQITTDTFISACKVYDDLYFFLNKDEIEKFKANFNEFIYKYLYTKKDSEDVISDLKLLRENKIYSYTRYWDCVVSTDTLKLIDDTAFKYIIETHLIPLYYVLYNKNVSRKYEMVIRELLLNSIGGIEFYTNQYDFPKEDKYKYYLPKFSENEIDMLIEKYINSSIRNPNHLFALKNHKNNKDSYIIKPERFVDIEKAYDECFNDPNIITNKVDGPMIEIGLSEEISIPFYDGYYKGHKRFVSSKKFIDKNLELDNYINILIYSLNLLDEQGRIKSIYNPYNEDTSFILENRTINQYGGMYFNGEQRKINIHFSSVAQYLTNINHPIEEYLEYLVNDFFKNEYKIEGFHIDLKVQDSKYKIKCEHLFDEMQNFIKQYDSYCRVGKVSSDLMRYLSISCYSNLATKIDKKYFVVNSKGDLIKIFHLLFSNQSPLNFLEKFIDEDLTFLQIVLTKKVKKEEYISRDQEYIDFLIDNDLLYVKDGYLCVRNFKMILLLKELYEKGFVNYYYLKDEYKKLIDECLNKKWILQETKLLSTLESDYFEYYLSDKKYSGNPGLRNKYEHGSLPNLSDDEAYMDYCIGLRLFTILILKIREEINVGSLIKN